MDLYIYQNFNNYFNKQVKKFDTLAEYGAPVFAQVNVNFKPNDGVDTTVTIGGKEKYDGNGDYLIVADDDNNITSRWFIIDQKRNREGQFSVTLRRDLMVDFYDSVMNDSLIYLEKGWINDLSNPLLFNDEGFRPNQIKKEETLLKDKSKCKWLVGYVDKNAGDTDNNPDTKEFWNGTIMKTEVSGNIRVDEEVDSWASWDLWPFVSGTFYAGDNIQTTMSFKRTGYSSLYAQTANKNGFIEIKNLDTGESITSKGFVSSGKKWAAAYAKNFTKINKEAAKVVGADMNYEQYTRLMALNGKIIHSKRTGDNPRYIKINATQISTPAEFMLNLQDAVITSSNAPNAINELNKIANQTYGSDVINPQQYKARLTSAICVKTSYESMSESYKNYQWETSSAGHAHLTQEAYDMFAIPVAEEEAGIVRVLDSTGVYTNIRATQQVGFTVAQHLIQQAGSGGYDLQLLPFAPIEDSLIRNDDGAGVIFDARNLQDTFDYSIVTDVPGVEGVQATGRSCIFWITRNSFSHEIKDVSIENPTDEKEIKAANQLDVYFLSSGDYSSSFEFKPARNRGVDAFIVNCTYKPYQPYIRVCPRFNENGLYGKDFDDTRGLVCSGTNFSLSRGGDAWATFERNNLNYQNAWNREINYMDKMHVFDRAESIVGAVTGSIGSSAAGAMASGHWAGAVVGGVVGLGGGVADIVVNEAKYQLNRDNAIAAHNESMANIKAQPDTLAATGGNTYNNKVFPILTYYSCDPLERELFDLNLQTYGMTINCLTENLTDYLNSDSEAKTYIKGQLIRLNNTNEDNHLVYEIAQELMKGVYI